MQMLKPLALIALWGCAEPTPAPIDLDGPRGRATAPGPWPVRVFSRDAPGRIAVRVDDGPLVDVPLVETADGGRAGLLPDAPIGAELRYFAEVDGRFEPASGAAQPRVVEVVPVRPPVPPARGGCRLSFRWPIADLRLTAALDAAPQFGLQLTVIVDTSLADGEAARLTVTDETVGDGGVGYSGVAGSGVIGFDAVTLPAGVVTLTAAATPPGGDDCTATIRVRSAGPESAP